MEDRGCLWRGKRGLWYTGRRMVTLISGGRDGGKTSRMKALYQRQRHGDGFVSEKVFREGRHIGYRLRRLADDSTTPLAYALRHIPEGWIGAATHGRFSFGAAGLATAGQIARRAAAAGGPVYMDEIGKWELGGGGFAALLRHVLDAGVEVVITVRDVNVKDVVEVFGIQNHVVVPAREVPP